MRPFIFIILFALTSCVIIEVTDVASEQADTVVAQRTRPDDSLQTGTQPKSRIRQEFRLGGVQM